MKLWQFLIVWAVQAAIGFGMLAGIIYVSWHFIEKFW